MAASERPMPAFLLDTGVIIAAQSPEDIHHEASAALVRAGEEGRARLLAGVGVGYDLEAASAERRAARLAWLSAHGVSIVRVPGPFTLDVSRLESGDVLVSDADSEPMERLREILGTTRAEGNEESWRRRQIDLHHAYAALLNRSFLVTLDHQHLLRRSDEIHDAVGLLVLAPDKALHML